MSSVLYNGWAVLVEPTSTPSTDALQLVHATSSHSAIRCSIRQMSQRAEIAALGSVGVGVWQVRLHSSSEIRPGWRVLITRDGETEQRSYEVRGARKATHWLLTVERV